MTTTATSMLLWGLALTLLLTVISIFLSRSAGAAGAGPNPLTRFFLVALRLAIGWHFFVEGMDKLNSPSWSSEPYLREATGPLAPHFREIAGDRLIDKLTLGQGGSFPSELNLEWQAYLDELSRFYELDAEQTKKANAIFEQAKGNMVTWLASTAKPVQKISEYPPPLIAAMTMPQRLKEYQELEAKVREAEDVLIPKYGADAFAKLKTAKANLNKWRAELKNDLDQKTVEFKQALRDYVLIDRLVVPFAGASATGFLGSPLGQGPMLTSSGLFTGVTSRSYDKLLTSLQNIHHQLLLQMAAGQDVKLTPQAAKVFAYVIDRKKDKQDPSELLPSQETAAARRAARPLGAWNLLDWSDFLVKWGITLTGTFLLLGLLTRTACVAGAALLLMFFLAMPPLPGWPESPRAEGHYLYINKNIIEMLALLTLATTWSGRWAGLDGLIQFLRRGRWQNEPASGTLERVVRLDEEPTLAINEPNRK